jgi:DNA-binding response OmpR family regulator
MTKSKRVLIIDDSREIVSATSVRLRASGFGTIGAFDGQQGFDAAIDIHPDAIVLDVRMPVKDGLATLAALKDHEATKSIPVIMLSASIIDQQAALDAGARHFMRKPYEGHALVEALKAVLTVPPNEPAAHSDAPPSQGTP